MNGALQSQRLENVVDHTYPTASITPGEGNLVKILKHSGSPEDSHVYKIRLGFLLQHIESLHNSGDQEGAKALIKELMCANTNLTQTKEFRETSTTIRSLVILHLINEKISGLASSFASLKNSHR